MGEQKLLRRFVFWSALALGLSFAVQFATAEDPNALLAAIAAFGGAAFLLVGRRPESQDELRRSRVLSLAIIIAFVALAALLTAFPLEPRANTAFMSVLLGAILAWVLWRQFGRRRQP